jgi:low temperature requirement protein LtrA
MGEKRPAERWWRELHAEDRARRRTIAALIVVLAVVGAFFLTPGLAGPGLILAIQIIALGLLVYLAVRLALRKRQP